MATSTSTAPVTATDLIAAYDAVTGDTAATDRRAMRKAWNAAMVTAVSTGDLAAAQVYVAADTTVSERRPARAAAEVDYVAATALRVATLRHAASLLEAGTVRPFGSPDPSDDDTWVSDLAAAIGNDDRPTIDAATDLAKVRVAGQRNVSDQIAAVVTADDVTKGTGFTAAAIRKGHADSSSIGAITAALESIAAGDRKVPGVRVTRRDGRQVAVRA